MRPATMVMSVMVVALVFTGCRTAIITVPSLPAGSGVPEPEAISWWTSATAACRGASTFSAEIRITGRVGPGGVRGKLRGAITRAGDMRLEAPAPLGAPIFVLAGRADRATLTIPRERRVLVAPAADIVEALVGVRLAPADWLDVLSGCVTSVTPNAGERFGDVIIASAPGSGRVQLRKIGADWRVVAGEHLNLQIQYRQFDGRWPREAQVASRQGAPVLVALRLTISQIFVNETLSPRTFEIAVPADYSPMTLEELRAAGPLGDRGGTQ